MPHQQQARKTYRLCDTTEEDYVPICSHGPTLLFAYTDSDEKVVEKFYACSACRDRKDCQFYQVYGKVVSEEKKKMREEIYHQDNKMNLHFKYRLKDSPPPNQFCDDCGVLLPHELCKDKSHSVLYKDLSTDDLKSPSRWMPPKESNKTNAQYFFSADVTDFILSTVTQHKFDGVLCIGTPSIHEALVHGRSDGIRSFLLDIDVRLRQFHADYGHYNMFNHHFFNAEEEKKFQKFLKDARCMLIIIDPPYGGLLQALQWSINKIKTAVCGKVYTMLFFPYFNEPQVTEYMTDLQMSDYKVDYTNHSGYRGGSGGKQRGSPARIYTDIPLQELVLPKKYGYKLCASCSRYVCEENQHCVKCNSCTTKDGPTYIHCDSCDICVKPSWRHCACCEKCRLIDHKCAAGTTTPTGNRKRTTKRTSLSMIRSSGSVLTGKSKKKNKRLRT